MPTLILLVALVCFPTTSMANTFTTDSRKVLAKNNPPPWRAVGILYRPGKNYCTAYLVGPDLLATAAACVADHNNELVNGIYTFYPGIRKGKAKYSAKATHIWWGKANDGRQDWALLRLDWKVGDRVGWFGIQAFELEELPLLERQRTIYMAGYSYDIGKASYPVWQKDCGPKNILNGSVYHDCSAGEGSAGSPIFIFRDVDGRETSFVIAMHVGERRDGAKTTLMGVPYSPSVANVAVPSKTFIDKIRELLKTTP